MGELHQEVHVDPPRLPVQADRFEHGVQANRVAVLEAVGQGLLAPVDADRDAVEPVRFDAGRERGGTEPEHADGRVVDAGRLALPRDGEPDLVRDLGGEVVEGPGGDEADDPLGDAPGDGDEVGVAQGRCVREPVQAAAERFDHAGVAELVQGAAVDAGPAGVGHAQDAAVPAEELDRGTGAWGLGDGGGVKQNTTRNW
jgi:hypothetical protein